MSKIKVGVLSFSDVRADVHESLKEEIGRQADQIKEALASTGEITVFDTTEIVRSNGTARECALQLKALLLDAVVFNVPVFAFPNFSLIASSILKLPTFLISNVNGNLPGLGGLQAATNLMRQCGYSCEKAWGNIKEKTVLDKCMRFLRAAYASSQLNGSVFGLIGGRSIGMGSGVACADSWQRTFGVDIDHVDQSEILRRADGIDDVKVESAFRWLSEHVNIEYDEEKLTEKSLKTQLRHYYATKDICEEKSFAFVGVKCHYEMSAYYCTQCLSAAFFNDPYDWDGPKETRVFTCEADCEGGLTMQIMKLLSGKPAIFSDLRFYNKEQGVFYLCNCGAMATWYSSQSDNFLENLRGVSLRPIISKYAGQGAHVQYVAAGSSEKMTFGRLTHDGSGFIFTVFTGHAINMPERALEETCPVWPHIFVVADAPVDSILEKYDCNHVHAVAGDYVEEIRQFCRLKNIEFRYIVTPEQ